MAESAPTLNDFIEIPVAHLVTEDEEAVDNFYQDKQAQLLTEVLDCSWPEGRPFVSAADVGIFATNQEAAVVPDVLLSLGVSFPPDILEKSHRSYFIWHFGKPPEVVIEIVSNLEGGEDDAKLQRYARIKVPYYVIWDPKMLLSQRRLRIRQLSGASYVDKVDNWFPEVGLGLCVHRGVYDGMEENWLRWCDQNGQVLLTGKERADAEAQRADAEAQRAEAEAQRADAEASRAEAEAQRADAEAQRAEAERERRLALEARLRELGELP
jgi:Uma2 family endonuclease